MARIKSLTEKFTSVFSNVDQNPVFTIPLRKGKTRVITDNELDEWKKNYPDMDVAKKFGISLLGIKLTLIDKRPNVELIAISKVGLIMRSKNKAMPVEMDPIAKVPGITMWLSSMRYWRKKMETNEKKAFFASLAVIAETVNRKISPSFDESVIGRV